MAVQPSPHTTNRDLVPILFSPQFLWDFPVRDTAYLEEGMFAPGIYVTSFSVFHTEATVNKFDKKQ